MALKCILNEIQNTCPQGFAFVQSQQSKSQFEIIAQGLAGFTITASESITMSMSCHTISFMHTICSTSQLAPDSMPKVHAFIAEHAMRHSPVILCSQRGTIICITEIPDMPGLAAYTWQLIAKLIQVAKDTTEFLHEQKLLASAR